MPCMRNSNFWKILLALYLIGVFCIYLIQNTPDKTNILPQSGIQKNKTLSKSDTIKSDSLPQSDAIKNDNDTRDSIPSNTWITMGLCWSGNAQILGKNKFPYKESVPLSTQLWHKFTPAKVIVQIVYDDEITDELEEYKENLEKLGATVFLVPTGKDIKCVLKSQLIRLLAQHFPFIHDNDIIVTADVDAFLMTKDLYKPLTLDRKIYLYRYSLTLDTGMTFMMPFIGIKASVWRKMFKNYDLSQDQPEKGLVGNGLPKMIEFYREKLQAYDSSWYIDQDIFSHEILSTGLCSLPKNNALWDKLKIDPNVQREFDDKKTCWHGPAIYEDCNNASIERNLKLRYFGGNCKWWHFTPDERYPALKSKFDEIMNGKTENPIVKYLIDSARSFHPPPEARFG